jgi:hypothetical protein
LGSPKMAENPARSRLVQNVELQCGGPDRWTTAPKSALGYRTDALKVSVESLARYLAFDQALIAADHAMRLASKNLRHDMETTSRP